MTPVATTVDVFFSKTKGGAKMADADTFRKKLERLINEESRENKSDTPDYILAIYLERCLEAFECMVRTRDDWYRFDPATGKIRQD